MIDQAYKAECARRFHGLGLVLLPVHYPVSGHCSCRAAWTCGSAAKHPASSWKSVREQSEDALEHVLSDYPRHNLGASLATSRLVVLDVHPAEAGGQALAAFEERRGEPLPATLRVITGSGGGHLYYRLPKDAHLDGSSLRFLHGVNAVARGGMLVVPPSVGMTGHPYAFDPASPAVPATLPMDVLRRLSRASRVRMRARLRQHPTLHAPGRAERSVVL
jgi:hypothetical protein